MPLLGKDITHKLYSMNEHLLSAASAHVEQMARQEAQQAARQEQAARWGLGSGGSESLMLHRSLSVDAVHTGSRGHVRSLAWRARQLRRSSMLSDRKISSLTIILFSIGPRYDYPVMLVNIF
jgi:hypothetical protein